MPQLVDILLFTVLDPTASGFELRTLLLLLRSGETAGSRSNGSSELEQRPLVGCQSTNNEPADVAEFEDGS